ncbi:HD domain-containing protein [Epilithonimonas arachidiradicis]|uniref:HD domain-containing protein n=1 Tax=Epilithonimonas arachidiradicis TaxID=1617282 RepID=A0A420D8V2_9FLAO|nr:HD domain-containing protein [Epilithonimonas arachidiradicis]RKE87274.1 HD domain-containing protein [Epilithonimonas arachidiradicis]GGG59654.1 hypothetical protein GCM10007332_21660 [Epilithonimonas arachidiradicis]
MEQLGVLNTVLDFARKAHGGQMRKYSPDPYIVHPIRVMEICKQFTGNLSVLSAALLHDVLEDTEYTATELSIFLSNYMSKDEMLLTLQLVTELTDVYDRKNYPELNRFTRKKKELQRLSTISPLAQTIKYADIVDNAGEIFLSDPDFAPRYLQECLDIVTALQGGHPILRTQAIAIIEMEQQKIKRTSQS